MNLPDTLITKNDAHNWDNFMFWAGPGEDEFEHIKDAHLKQINQSSHNTTHLVYGIITSKGGSGVQAHAIDGKTGEIISSHFCSSEGFAKSDLGFTDPLFQRIGYGDAVNDIHSTVYFNEAMRKKYSDLYPDGCILQWIGWWENDPVVKQLCINKKI